MGAALIFKRYLAFTLLLAPTVGLVILLRSIGASADLALAMAFVPVLAMFVWNARQSQDRFHGMAVPTLSLLFFLGLMGAVIERDGTIYTYLKGIGLVGVLVSLLWVMSLLLGLWGSKKHPFS